MIMKRTDIEALPIALRPEVDIEGMKLKDLLSMCGKHVYVDPRDGMTDGFKNYKLGSTFCAAFFAKGWTWLDVPEKSSVDHLILMPSEKNGFVDFKVLNKENLNAKNYVLPEGMDVPSGLDLNDKGIYRVDADCIIYEDTEYTAVPKYVRPEGGPIKMPGGDESSGLHDFL